MKKGGPQRVSQRVFFPEYPTTAPPWLAQGQREGAEMELAVMRAELCALGEQCRAQRNELALHAAGRGREGGSGSAPARMAEVGTALADAHRAAADARASAAEAARSVLPLGCTVMDPDVQAAPEVQYHC